MRPTSTASLLTLALSYSGVSAQGQQFCDPELSDLCFQEITATSGVTYRFAIPASAEEGFPAILQIVAPIEVGWAGLAWASSMTNGPLTMAWANAENVTISPRKAEVYAYPDIDPTQSLSALSAASSANETHWKATILCQEGCSSYTNSAGDVLALDPASTAVPVAWASSDEAPETPADPESSFSVHSATGYFSLSLLDAQTEGFDGVVGA